MDSLNNQIVTIHRRVKEIEYNEETNNWDIVFIDVNGNEKPGTMSAKYTGMNYYLALQIIFVNYCINNEPEANLWRPNVALVDIQVTTLSKSDEPALYQYYIEYENGIAYGWKDSEHINPIEIVENLIIKGIMYYIDKTDYNNFIPKWVIIRNSPGVGAVISIFNNPSICMKATVTDNANMDITDESIKMVYPYIIKAALMLYGMVSTKLKIHGYFVGNFTNCQDLKIPSFSITEQAGMCPEAVVFDDLTYTVTNSNGDLILSVNE